MAGASVDGLVSNMDTTAVINQLLSIEKQPQVRLQNRVTTVNQTISILRDLNARMMSLGTAASGLSSAASWQTMSATSTSSTVRVTAQAGAQPTQLTFDVVAAARAASSVSAGTVSGTTAPVMTGNTITITKGVADPATTTIAVSDTSLAGVVSAINASDAGVRAAAVQVSPGNYRLQLTSSTTGAESTFSVAGLDLVGGIATLTTGQDADVLVGGTSPGAYHITSATNTLSLLPGVTVTVSQPATAVTIEVRPDGASIANTVDAMVSAANAALGAIAQQTSYDASKNKAGALLGDSTVATLQRQLLDSVSAVIGGKTLASVGIELTRDGMISFDRQKFLDAYAADPAGTEAQFRPGGTFSPTTGVAADAVTFMGAGDRTPTGTYTVQVTQAATRAHATLSGTYAAGEAISIGFGSATPLAYTTDASDVDAAALAANLNRFAAANKLAVTAAVEGGDVVIRADAYGSAIALDVTTGAGGLVASAVTPGRDVEGTINGIAATGAGQVLSTDAGNDMLALRINATDADVAAAGGGPFGTFEFRAGFAQRLGNVVSRTTDLVDGSLSTAIDGKQSQVDTFTKQIAAWDVRLALRETALRRQFTAMETALGQLRDRSNWLAGQLAGLMSGQ